MKKTTNLTQFYLHHHLQLDLQGGALSNFNPQIERLADYCVVLGLHHSRGHVRKAKRAQLANRG